MTCNRLVIGFVAARNTSASVALGELALGMRSRTDQYSRSFLSATGVCETSVAVRRI